MPTGQTALVGLTTVELKSFDLPDVAPRTALLEVLGANACGTDLHQRPHESVALRHSGLGHEFVARILALGDGVTTDSRVPEELRLRPALRPGVTPTSAAPGLHRGAR